MKLTKVNSMKKLLAISLSENISDIELIGGKGRSLSLLNDINMPVPIGFSLATTAYKIFIEKNHLLPVIRDLIDQIEPNGSGSLERAAEEIRWLFSRFNLPRQVVEVVKNEYAKLGSNTPAVAVRSSATAEDLADMSFAGQHDSYLNIRGEEALIKAIRECWASLWSIRAIGYRMHMKIDHFTVAMSVVIQKMVIAEVAGVMFTANPTTGSQNELVINANYGLGETTVSGEATPDTYIVNRSSLTIQDRILGSKEKMTSVGDSGEVVTAAIPDKLRRKTVLTNKQLIALAKLGTSIEGYFSNKPQDIEWAISEGRYWILQSRPITNISATLSEEVQWNPPFPGLGFIRRQIAENIPGPVSPLFEDIYIEKSLNKAWEAAQVENGSIEKSAENAFPHFVTINGYTYQTAGNASQESGPYLFSIWRLLKVYRRVFFKAIPRWRDVDLPKYIKITKRWDAVNYQCMSNKKLVRGIKEISKADAFYWSYSCYALAASKFTDVFLSRLLVSENSKSTSGEFLSGFNSKAVDAQIELESIAKHIESSEHLRIFVLSTPTDKLIDGLENTYNGKVVLEKINRYLGSYGHQIYSHDFFQPTQKDDPSSVLLNLRYLVKNTDHNTLAMQKDLARNRKESIRSFRKKLNPVKRKVFDFLLKLAQYYGATREDVVFYLGIGWPTLRQFVIEIGNRLAKVGLIEDRMDAFFLKIKELESALEIRRNKELNDSIYRILVSNRRKLYEQRKRLHPPVTVPIGFSIKPGIFSSQEIESQKQNSEEAKTLEGFAVSPGMITAPAVVIESPDDFDKMVEGAILVCHTTTPAWTPLFAQCRGLVTEIGGLLSHGSIVAREYNIPAVMGVGGATRQIMFGQKVTVDGDAGKVILE